MLDATAMHTMNTKGARAARELHQRFITQISSDPWLPRTARLPATGVCNTTAHFIGSGVDAARTSRMSDKTGGSGNWGPKNVGLGNWSRRVLPVYCWHPKPPPSPTTPSPQCWGGEWLSRPPAWQTTLRQLEPPESLGLQYLRIPFLRPNTRKRFDEGPVCAGPHSRHRAQYPFAPAPSPPPSKTPRFEVHSRACLFQDR